MYTWSHLWFSGAHHVCRPNYVDCNTKTVNQDLFVYFDIIIFVTLHVLFYKDGYCRQSKQFRIPHVYPPFPNKSISQPLACGSFFCFFSQITTYLRSRVLNQKNFLPTITHWENWIQITRRSYTNLWRHCISFLSTLTIIFTLWRIFNTKQLYCNIAF